MTNLYYSVEGVTFNLATSIDAYLTPFHVRKNALIINRWSLFRTYIVNRIVWSNQGDVRWQPLFIEAQKDDWVDRAHEFYIKGMSRGY